MKNTKLADVAVNAQANALAEILKSGFIDIYDGDQPGSPEQGVGNRTLCVSLELGSPAFLPADRGVISANPIKAADVITDVNAATWARLYKSDHKTAVLDVSVGTKDANIILPTTHLVRGVKVSVSSFTHSVSKSTAGT